MGVLLRSIKGPGAPVADIKPAAPDTNTRPSDQRHAGSARPYVGPSLLSAAISIVGKLESTGDIQIDGKIEGEIRGQAVRIGGGASVKGSIVAEIVELSGTIEGKIEAKSVILTRTARMTGDITYQSLQIDQGASFDGNSRPQPGRSAPETVHQMQAALAAAAE